MTPFAPLHMMIVPRISNPPGKSSLLAETGKSGLPSSGIRTAWQGAWQETAPANCRDATVRRLCVNQSGRRAPQAEVQRQADQDLPDQVAANHFKIRTEPDRLCECGATGDARDEAQCEQAP